MSRTRVPGSARRVVARSAVAVLAAALTAGFSGGTSAVASPGNLAPSAPKPVKSISKSALLGEKLSPRLNSAKGKVTAFVELAETPAVDAYNTDLRRGKAAAKAAARAAKSKVDKQADSVVANLRGKDRNAKVISRTRNAISGVTVVADAAKLRELASDPQVRSIRLTVPKKTDNSSAAVLTRVLNEWQSNGKLGDNVRVGIIDTGIDYSHSNFGGPGTTAAYNAINPDAADPSFPTAKVVGGTDFVGDAYDGSSDDPAVATPVPDPNPLDCNGHGSHVAGTAAGFGVNADGSTFTGNYTALNVDALNNMRIGPGMAPKALLYALKVFGCDGSTNVVSAAMDWALDPDQDGDFTDHLDVVNLSLGSDYGAPDDPESAFVRKLNANGVLTVFSAGNGGDLYDIGGSPGNTPEALTVASIRDSYVLRDAAEVTAPPAVAGQKAGQYSVNYTQYATLDRTKPVVKLSAANNADGCLAFSAADAAAVAGKFAWLEWDDNDATRRCGSGGRTTNASNAGALGVILSSTLNDFPAGIAGNAVIPAFQLTGDGTAQVRPALNAGTLSIRLAGSLRTALKTFNTAIEDTPSEFTSRGTRTNVKPDVAAPGDTIASTAVGSGNDVAVISGTSMASPHVAGITALIRQAHPDWTTAEVKAAVINTAGHDVSSQNNHGGPIEAPNRTGVGRVDAKSALDNNVLAYDEAAPATVSAGFGVVEAGGPVSLTKTIKVVNKGVTPASFNVGYHAVTSIPGVNYTLDKSSITLSPRGIARVRITLSIPDPKALRKVADPTIVKDQLGVARQFLADASGRIELTPTSGASVPLRVAVYSAPKPVADINTPARINVPRSGQGVLNLSGKGVAQGNGDQRYESLISALELQATSPKLPACSGTVMTDCTVNETARGGDLRFVGAASTAPLANLQGNPADAMLGFGIATWGDWYNIGSNTQPFVDIDVDGDGSADFETFVTKPTDTDVLVAETVDLNTGDLVDIQGVNGLFGDVDSNVFDTNVIVLPVLLTALGIDPTADTARISYQVGVAGFYSMSGGLVDSIAGSLSFDPLKPGLWVQGGGDPALSYVSRPGTALVVNRDPAALALDHADSLLILNHHNAKGDRASIVKVTGPAAAATARANA